MKVNLIQHSSLSTCVRAIRTCWDSHEKGGCYTEPTDNILESDKKLLARVVLQHKHGSTAEHINYSFDIDGISRACLQELARHRHASMSVKSTRYTLKELKEHDKFSLVRPSDYLVGNSNTEAVNNHNIQALENLYHTLKDGVSNDIAKYCLPEAYKTSLVWTINMRSLQNFLALRTNKAALWEIRDLAYEIYKQLPEEHKYMFTEFLYEEK